MVRHVMRFITVGVIGLLSLPLTLVASFLLLALRVVLPPLRFLDVVSEATKGGE